MQPARTPLENVFGEPRTVMVFSMRSAVDAHSEYDIQLYGMAGQTPRLRALSRFSFGVFATATRNARAFSEKRAALRCSPAMPEHSLYSCESSEIVRG